MKCCEKIIFAFIYGIVVVSGATLLLLLNDFFAALILYHVVHLLNMSFGSPCSAKL
jgi:hypothetical protein